MSHHGHHHGNRIARKHIGWAIGRLAERNLLSDEQAASWRVSLLRSNDNELVKRGLRDLYQTAQAVTEAA